MNIKSTFRNVVFGLASMGTMIFLSGCNKSSAPQPSVKQLSYLNGHVVDFGLTDPSANNPHSVSDAGIILQDSTGQYYEVALKDGGLDGTLTVSADDFVTADSKMHPWPDILRTKACAFNNKSFKVTITFPAGSQYYGAESDGLSKLKSISANADAKSISIISPALANQGDCDKYLAGITIYSYSGSQATPVYTVPGDSVAAKQLFTQDMKTMVDYVNDTDPITPGNQRKSFYVSIRKIKESDLIVFVK